MYQVEFAIVNSSDAFIMDGKVDLMTNDIIRLCDALIRDNEDNRLRDRLNRDSAAISRSLVNYGEYRVETPKGTILIRSERKTA